MAVCRTVSAKSARHHPHVRMRRWFLTAKRAMLVPRDRCVSCRPHHTPDAGADGPRGFVSFLRSSKHYARMTKERTQAMRIWGAQERASGT